MTSRRRLSTRDLIRLRLEWIRCWLAFRIVVHGPLSFYNPLIWHLLPYAGFYARLNRGFRELAVLERRYLRRMGRDDAS